MLPLCSEGKYYRCSPEPERGICKIGVKYCYGDRFGDCIGKIPPRRETCNNLDDDCDGIVDEEMKNLCGFCGPTPEEICNNLDDDCDDYIDERLALNEELCNGLDDDCDGRADEGWTKRLACEIEETNDWILYSDDDPDSRCERGYRLCRDGGFTECFEFIGPTPEVCDSMDNDCDGDIDESLELQETCGITEEGVCSHGAEYCVNNEIICFGAVLPNTEICDALDNDCDGEIDEDLARACSTECDDGIETCSLGGWVDCTAFLPRSEVCNGHDDDCDGEIDEGIECPCIEGQMKPCMANPCGFGLQVCSENGTWSECQGVIPQIEVCNGHDDDCDGEVDGMTRICFSGDPVALGFPPCQEGNQACLSGEWGECVGEILPLPEICDDIDNDCDGALDNIINLYEKGDIVFILDVSGSMRGIMDALLGAIREFVGSFDEDEHKFGIVVIGMSDYGEIVLHLELSPIQALIASLENFGFPEGGIEPSLNALYKVASPLNTLQINWRNDSTPFVIIFTDEQAQLLGDLELSDIFDLVMPCGLPGCSNQTNENWTDGDPLELFVFTKPEFYNPWNTFMIGDRQRLFNIQRVSYEYLLQADLNLVFSELCLEE
jgi:hypothetical protein